jgi:hypothetical protein
MATMVAKETRDAQSPDQAIAWIQSELERLLKA